MIGQGIHILYTKVRGANEIDSEKGGLLCEQYCWNQEENGDIQGTAALSEKESEASGKQHRAVSLPYSHRLPNKLFATPFTVRLERLFSIMSAA